MTTPTPVPEADYDIRARIFAVPGENTGAGTDGPDTMEGTAGTDVFSGGAGDDTFLFDGAGHFAAGDLVDGGADADRLILRGAYSSGVQFDAATLSNVETILLISARDAAYGGGSSGYFGYNLTPANATVAAGETLTVDGSGLAYGEAVMFYGQAEADGRFILLGGGSVDWLFGGAGDDLFDGGLGADRLSGGGGNDTFRYDAPAELSGDRVNGGAGTDRLLLDGAFSSGVRFDANSMTGVERIVLGSAPAGGYNSYNLTMNDANVAAGDILLIDGTALRWGEILMFYGQGEANGRFDLRGGAARDWLFGGQGADIIRGGLGSDYIAGGAGADTLLYSGAAESTRLGFDRLAGFDYGEDRLDLTGGPRSHGGTVEGGRLAGASFDADLAAAAVGMDAAEGIFFRPDSGDYAGRTFLIVDDNGVAGYQAGEDYVFDVSGSGPVPLDMSFVI